jgi:hypothetical protein
MASGDAPITEPQQHEENVMLNKDTRTEIAAEVARQLRTQRLDEISGDIDMLAALEARRDSRIPSARTMVAKTWAEGIEQARKETPRPGSFTGIGGIRVSDVPENETEEESETRLAARAAANYRKELQTERHSREADRIAAEWIGAEPAEDGAETVGLASRLRDLLPRRSKSSDDGRYEIG